MVNYANFDQFGLLYLLMAPLVLQPFFSSLLSPHINDDSVHGYVDEEFHAVRDAFQRNFGEGLEREGAAFAVYRHGRRVAHLWGGFADGESNRKWKPTTRSVLFSATKAIASLVIATLVDRGLIDYEDRVVTHWPGYGQYGKNSTTIEDVLSHKAGVPYLDEDVLMDDVIGGLSLLEKVERTKPLWMPGTASGYHAVTFGFIVDGIVRKVDPKGRSLKTYFQEEIAEPHNLDISIGVEKKEAPFLARITMPSMWEYVRDIFKDPKILVMLGLMHFRFDTIVHRIKENPKWLIANYDTMSLNDPDVVSLPLPAVTGVSSADDLARLFSLAIHGEILSNMTLTTLAEPTLNSWHLEKVTIWPVMKGHGFFYERHPLIPGAFTFGHPGYGCQFVHVDPKSGISLAYVSNGLKTGSGELCGPYTRLLRATYNSIRYI
ncbi:unnamed protein product [Caenorhabditis auriculariae]|uniref:Beta-lactamase-related domain-containing protein n=1 Tax=Caenorhabditis auriculariae TaxID=2777116 RepID=A0A8S1HBC4_9PELO|nr:unnamed protein product [Caenorhabditis auriculariae]